LFATSAIMFPICWYYWGLNLGWMTLAFSVVAVMLSAAIYFFVHWFWKEYPSCRELREAKRSPLLVSQILCYLLALFLWIVYLLAVPYLRQLPQGFIYTTLLTLVLGYVGFALLKKINTRILRSE
jgi:predicted neutral ceramidase superfamily lipid hydrolase